MNAPKNEIKLTPISELLNLQFFIPAFQRGYRWTSFEVKDLLNDIYEFIIENEKSEKSAFYCLQPLIVYEKDNKYYLIDGQQRLTTIHIILSFLKPVATLLGKDILYELDYETRPDSREYLKNINSAKADENIDYYHIYHAYKAVHDWFADKDGTFKMEFVKTLSATNEVGKNVKFVWYEIEEEDAVNVFTRINIGKIPLTNAELVKALFIRERNFSTNGITKKIFLASEWDYIEKRLSEPSFWYFLTNEDINTKYDNKIEFLLDIISERSPEHEKLHTFHYFNRLVTHERSESLQKQRPFDIDMVWKTVKDKFQQLEEWFIDHNYYHLVGYLLASGRPITDLLNMASGKSKDSFVNLLRSEIKTKLIGNIDIDELTFERSADKLKIRRLLLLFNIESIIQSKKAYIKFPFDRYKKEAWDIEHINAQSPFNNLAFYEEWCLDIVEYITGMRIEASKLKVDFPDYEGFKEIILSNISADGVEVISKVFEIFNSDEPQPLVEELAELLFKKFKVQDDEDTHGLSNLTLLDPSTNRGYGNAVFPIKRNRIILNDREGIFTPICTKNVFLKYYSKQFDDVLYWKKADAAAYLEEIRNTLNFYLN